MNCNNSQNMGVGENGSRGVILKSWKMKNLHYVLACGWNNIGKANGLKDGDSINADESSVLVLVPLP
ncbi:hypothetical protein HID58_085889, partial [Brassica napus]